MQSLCLLAGVKRVREKSVPRRVPADIVGDDAVDPEPDPDPPPRPPAVAPVAEPPEPAAFEISGDGGGGFRPAPAGLPEMIEGMPLSIVRGRKTDSHKYHSRLMVHCDNPLHRAQGCSKTRSVELQKAEFGDAAAVVYLGAWLIKSDMQRGGRCVRIWLC